MMTLAAAKAVARRYALHLARLNRIGRSPELMMHGASCLHRVFHAGLRVFEFIGVASCEGVLPLLPKDLPAACKAVLRQGELHQRQYLLREQYSAELARRGVTVTLDCKYGCGFRGTSKHVKADHESGVCVHLLLGLASTGAGISRKRDTTVGTTSSTAPPIRIRKAVLRPWLRTQVQVQKRQGGSQVQVQTREEAALRSRVWIHVSFSK
ncbi:MAG: hypothetical protein MHM6MM_006908 [Cercozoa sp. M6MM]